MRKQKLLLLSGVFLILLLSLACSSFAVVLNMGEQQLSFMGYINQGVYYGLHDDVYDVKDGFNSFVTQALLEANYLPAANMSFFVSGNFNGDWAYPIFESNDEWNSKQFDESRNEKFILDDWQDYLKEAHFTWADDRFYLRVGKQIVQWGETDGFLLTNLINPIDQRRGLGDVKFESTVIPIWMVRTEYNTQLDLSWLQSLGAQFILDPSFKFRGNQVILPGNDFMGVWAPNVVGGPGVLISSLNMDIETPDDFDPDGFTYGLKIRGDVMDSVIQLLFFYGRDRDNVSTSAGPPTIDFSPWEGGTVLVHPVIKGYYPRFKFVGATFTRDLSNLHASFLGGVSPILRLEALYAFDSTYGTSINSYYQTDEFRGVIGVDWKVKIPLLNSTNFFLVSPQYFYQRVIDYPDGSVNLVQRGSSSGGFFEDNHKATLMILTNYYHNKITPLFFWMNDITNRSSLIKIQCSYAPDQHWTYSLGTLIVEGRETGRGFEGMENKDQLFLTVNYAF